MTLAAAAASHSHLRVMTFNDDFIPPYTRAYTVYTV